MKSSHPSRPPSRLEANGLSLWGFWRIATMQPRCMPGGLKGPARATALSTSSGEWSVSTSRRLSWLPTTTPTSMASSSTTQCSAVRLMTIFVTSSPSRRMWRVSTTATATRSITTCASWRTGVTVRPSSPARPWPSSRFSTFSAPTTAPNPREISWRGRQWCCTTAPKWWAGLSRPCSRTTARWSTLWTLITCCGTAKAGSAARSRWRRLPCLRTRRWRWVTSSSPESRRPNSASTPRSSRRTASRSTSRSSPTLATVQRKWPPSSRQLAR
mmetsp:Transcript_7313/g.24007  ORF Transcript_7313/g.24007 Transcript_7313/m.24007 type:complete len:271 (-) Transcript_7313:300-1112(-)